MSRRALLGTVAGTAAVASISPFTASAAPMSPTATVIIGGAVVSTLRLIHENGADSQVLASVEVLRDCIQQATGWDPIVSSLSEASAAANPAEGRIYVGVASSEPPITTSELAGLGDDGYVIKVDAGTVAIRGNTSWGHRYGAYEFLERHLDVHWLMPTEIGIDVPVTTELSVPAGIVRDAPAFETRVLYPFPDVEAAAWNSVSTVPWRAQQQRTWGWQSRSRWKHRFNHYLWHVLPPTLFWDSHSEFYNGSTKPAGKTGWQPNLSAAGIAEAAAGVILKDLAAKPSERYYSLSANDSANFGAQDSHGHNELGFSDASAAYWKFVHDVVSLVAPQHPDVTFGALAYANTTTPPSFALHPQIMPVLAYERFNWMDPDRRAWDRRWIETWASRATQLGTWDYAYGSPYLLPRPYDAVQAEAYRTMKDNRVVAQLTELRPHWGEGPKAWIMAKLLWDPARDPAALEAEWCDRAVGSAAAPYLRQFYGLWTEFWRTRALDTAWFGSGRIFLPYGGVDYLEAVTEEDITTSVELLDSCVAHASPGRPQQRAVALRDLFQYYATTALSFPQQVATPTSEPDALALVDRTSTKLPLRLQNAAARTDYVAATLTDPLAGSYLPPANQGGFWSGWNVHEIAAVASYVRTHEPDGGPVSARIDDLQANPDPMQSQLGHYLRVLADGDERLLGTNMSFDDSPHRRRGGRYTTWTIPTNWTRDTSIARTRPASLRVPAQASAAATQKVPIGQGLLIFSTWIHSDPSQLQSGYIKLWLRLYDVTGKIRIRMLHKVCNPDLSSGQWARFSMGDVITEADVAAGVTTADCWIVVDTRSPLHLDDAMLQFVPA